MRVKIQVRQGNGLFQDVLIDPAQKHMLALDFSPDDLNFLSRRKGKQKGQERLILPAIPIRIKTRVGGPGGQPIDLVADRTNLDWISIELTASDIVRLLGMNPGPSSRLIVYAGPPGKSPVVMSEIEKFKSDWPEFCSKNTNDPKEVYGGMPKAIASNDALATTFRIWANDWPPMFHSGDKAPEAKLILPNGVNT